MKKDDKGFSFVELIIVIAIMAILIAVLAPQYLKYIEKSRKAKDDHMADSLGQMAAALASDEKYYVDVEEGDYIRFDVNGITTNNQAIRDKAFDDYISGWQGVKVCSREYKDKYFEVKFVAYRGDYRLAVVDGWH